MNYVYIYFIPNTIIYIYVCVCVCVLLFYWYRLCAEWTGGPVVDFGLYMPYLVGSRYTLLMKPIKVETVVQCSVCRI